MFYQPTIQDSRGQKLDLMAGHDSITVKDMLSKEERKEFNQVISEDFFGDTRASHLKNSFVFNIIVIGILVTYLGLVISRLLRAGWPNTWPVWIFMGIGSALVFRHFMRTFRRMKSLNAERPYAITIMNMKRCPACLYLLAELTVEPDGCTVCPECGGAWKLP